MKRDVQYSMNTGVSLRTGPHRVFPSVHIIVCEDSLHLFVGDVDACVARPSVAAVEWTPHCNDKRC